MKHCLLKLKKKKTPELKAWRTAAGAAERDQSTVDGLTADHEEVGPWAGQQRTVIVLASPPRREQLCSLSSHQDASALSQA